MRRRPNLFTSFLAGPILALALPAQAAVTVESIRGTAAVSHLGTSSALNAGDLLGERDVISVPVDSALRLRFGNGDDVELSGDAMIAIERLPDASQANEGKTILSLDHGLIHVVRPGGDDLVLPFHIFLGDQRASLSEGDFFFEREPRAVDVCAETGELTLPPTEFLPKRIVSGQNCYHNAGGDGAPRILQRDLSYFSQMRARLGVMAAAAAGPPLPVASIAPAAPVSMLSRDAPSAPLAASTAVASLSAAGVGSIGEQEPVSAASSALASLEAGPATRDWAINLGSFSQIQQANEEVQRLQAAGYPAAVESKEVSALMHYRVQLRGFASADAARVTAGEVASRFGYKDYFLIRTP